MWDKNEEMVSWYQEQINAESIVSKNISSVRRDAIISTISKMLEVGYKDFQLHIVYVLIYMYFICRRTVRMWRWTLLLASARASRQ